MRYQGEKTNAFQNGSFLSLERFKYVKEIENMMVLSMVDQHKPKCYLCSNVFENLEALRTHQEDTHKEFVEFHKDIADHSPTPGDVTIF